MRRRADALGKCVVLKRLLARSPATTCGVPSALVAGRTLVLGVPAQLIPASWQLEQAAELTALCTIAGGAAPLAFANTKELKVEAPWRSEEGRGGKECRSRGGPDP